jgi:hypothetical protein
MSPNKALNRCSWLNGFCPCPHLVGKHLHRAVHPDFPDIIDRLEVGIGAAPVRGGVSVFDVGPVSPDIGPDGHAVFGVQPDLPLPAVREGLAPTKAWKRRVHDQGWLVGDSLNAGIGQGFVLTSPLQLAVMTARIASGRAISPRLVRGAGGAPLADPVHPPLDINPAHLRMVREGMDAVMNARFGTARKSRIADPQNQMAGKTGTSQVRRITKAERATGVIRNEDLPWERRNGITEGPGQVLTAGALFTIASLG